MKKIFFLLILIISISLIFYLYKELKPKKPQEIKIESQKQELIEEKLEATPTEEIKENKKKPNLLFEKILLYPEIDYPYLYGYDPESKTIREINLEDKTYKEFYKESNIKFLSFSEDKTKIIFKKNENYYLLDTINDKLEKLPKSVKRVFWIGNNLYAYISTNELFYLANFKNTLDHFVDLYIFNPEFDSVKDGILVYENLKYTYSSPLILINNEKEKKFILNEGVNLSAISNKKDLIFVSLLEKSWKSYLIDINGVKLKEFNFGTLKEKCTFQELLICGVPLNQNISDITKWYYYKENFNDRLVIFDPQKNEIKYFDLIGNYDILKPTLSPIGIIFLNRFDNKLYVVPLE